VHQLVNKGLWRHRVGRYNCEHPFTLFTKPGHLSLF